MIKVYLISKNITVSIKLHCFLMESVQILNNQCEKYEKIQLKNWNKLE